MTDVLIVLGVAVYAYAGYRNGFVATALSLIGFALGTFAGLAVVPRVLDAVGVDADPVLTYALLLVGGVLGIAAIGQAVIGIAGARLAGLVRGHRVGRGIDGALGAVVAAVVTVALGWAVATAVRPSLPESWSRSLTTSRALGAADQVMPRVASDALAQVRGTAGDGFPQVFGRLREEPITPVTPPDPRVKHTPGLDAARASIVRVVAEARGCRRLDKGTGWVVSPERVVTNAHVVAGANAVTVSSGGTGRLRDARVVYLDPRLDIAVLDVPGLPVKPLPRAADLKANAAAVVAGFPLGGPYTLGSARVRAVIDAVGSDIYGEGHVERSVYSLYGSVRPGNSGGPLLDPDGRVVGVVFARSLDDASTGYAMTMTQVMPALAAGMAADTTVSTGACTAH